MSEQNNASDAIPFLLIFLAVCVTVGIAIGVYTYSSGSDRDKIIEASKDAVCARLAQTGPVDCDNWKATMLKDASASIVMEGDNKAEVALTSLSGMGIMQVTVVKDTDGNWRPE